MLCHVCPSVQVHIFSCLFAAVAGAKFKNKSANKRIKPLLQTCHNKLGMTWLGDLVALLSPLVLPGNGIEDKSRKFAGNCPHSQSFTGCGFMSPVCPSQIHDHIMIIDSEWFDGTTSLQVESYRQSSRAPPSPITQINLRF